MRTLIQTDKQTDRVRGRPTDRQMDRETDSKTDRQRGILMDRPKDRRACSSVHDDSLTQDAKARMDSDSCSTRKRTTWELLGHEVCVDGFCALLGIGRAVQIFIPPPRRTCSRGVGESGTSRSFFSVLIHVTPKLPAISLLQFPDLPHS